MTIDNAARHADQSTARGQIRNLGDLDVRGRNSPMRFLLNHFDNTEEYLQ
jgi:hypothetical protein